MSNSSNSLGTIPTYSQPWIDNKNTVWLGTTLLLARNLPKFFFPHLLTVDQQKQIYTLLSNALTQQPVFAGGLMKRGDECLPIDRDYLIEHFLLPYNQIQGSAGVGFLLNPSGSILAALNLENHLMMHGVDQDGNFEKTYKEMIQCEEKVQKSLGYAFSNRFGYVTVDPKMAGCGLKIKAILQPSALLHTKELQAFLESESKEGIEVLPLFKETSLDLLAIENRFCLGMTEDAILSGVKNFAEKLVEKEEKKRKELIEKRPADLLDKISRAFAIVKHSYQIEAQEAMNALSLIKLGVILKWVKGIEISQLNELFFIIRRAHFMKHIQENLTPEEVLHKRASFLHEKLKNLELIEI